MVNLTETIYSKSPTNTIAPSDRNAKIFLSLAIVLFIAARLWHLTASCLWFDEIFSVHAAEHSWATILPFTAADLVHPPLFYLLLKMWIGIGGESLLWLRLFPAIVSIAAIAPILLLACELKLSAAETALAMFLLAVSGYLIKYAREVRMYSLLFFLSTSSLWLFIAIVRRRQFSTAVFAGLTVVNLLMIYTHYYGWLVLALELGIALWTCRAIVKKLLLSYLLLLVAYVPWILLLARAFAVQRVNQNVGWIPRPGPRALLEFTMLISQPFLSPESNIDSRINPLAVILVMFIFAVPVFVLILKSRSRREPFARAQTIRLLAILTFTPIVTILLASWLLPRSIWGARHLIIVAVPFAMLAAIAIVRLRPYWARVSILLIVSCWFGAAAVYALIRPTPHFIWCAWGPLAVQVAQIDQSTSQTTLLYAFEDLVAYHSWFALKDSGSQTFKVSLIKNVPGTIEDTAYFLPRNFNEIDVRGPDIPNERRVWITFRAARLDEQQPPLRQFIEAGYEIKQVLNEKALNQNAFMIELERQ
jgi:uncharacterized membrane protein